MHDTDCSFSPATAYICLGSNQGDSPANLKAAREAINALPGTTLVAASSIYRTEPQGMRDQPFFFNQVIAVECASGAGAEAFLDQLLAAEAALGRVRDEAQRYGPRVIDIDLLLFGGERVESRRLALPHPRMLERAFVMVPLAEIAPDLQMPQGVSPLEALSRIRYEQRGDCLYQDEGAPA